MLFLTSILVLSYLFNSSYLWSDLRDDKLFCFIFPRTLVFDITYKLSPKDNLQEMSAFLEKIRPYFKMSSAEIFSQHAKH